MGTCTLEQLRAACADVAEATAEDRQAHRDARADVRAHLAVFAASGAGSGLRERNDRDQEGDDKRGRCCDFLGHRASLLRRAC